MADRIFTVDEAKTMLATVRPLAEEMVRSRRALLEAEEQRAAVAETAAGNGSGLNPREVAALDEALEREREVLVRSVAKIHEHGVQVKDVDSGLLDFPSRRDGEDILLCWRVGEPELAWWHGADEGFAGRKPLD